MTWDPAMSPTSPSLSSLTLPSQAELFCKNNLIILIFWSLGNPEFNLADSAYLLRKQGTDCLHHKENIQILEMIQKLRSKYILHFQLQLIFFGIDGSLFFLAKHILNENKKCSKCVMVYLHIHTKSHNHHFSEHCLDTYNKLIWFTVPGTSHVPSLESISHWDERINAFEN